MKITPATQAIIDTFSKDVPDTAPILYDCIQKYSCEKTFCGVLKYLVNRIINAVKSIFGHSLWQRAKIELVTKTINDMAGSNPVSESDRKALEKIFNPMIEIVLLKGLECQKSNPKPESAKAELENQMEAYFKSVDPKVFNQLKPKTA